MKKAKNTSNNTLHAVLIHADDEMNEFLQREYNTEQCIALKNDDYGFGVWCIVNDRILFGVYGDDILSKTAISLYWDKNSDEINKAIDDVKTIEECIQTANAVILGTIIDIEKAAKTSNAS